MDTLLIKKKITASKQIVVDLPQLNEGDEIELTIKVKSPTKSPKAKYNFFDMAKWADKWETDLGENVQSTNIKGFTGRDF
jgi:hypothetical protein